MSTNGWLYKVYDVKKKKYIYQGTIWDCVKEFNVTPGMIWSRNKSNKDINGLHFIKHHPIQCKIQAIKNGTIIATGSPEQLSKVIYYTPETIKHYTINKRTTKDGISFKRIYAREAIKRGYID